MKPMPAKAADTVITTFSVDDVIPATERLGVHKTHESLLKLLGHPVEACCDYTADCLSNVRIHPLFAAAHIAFSRHLPLVLSPDMIWVTILQGLTRHVRNDPEKWRSRFVPHAGKVEIEITRRDILPGSPENDWVDVIHEFSARVREHAGARYDDLVSDFSTTGLVERTACEVALLDTLQPYFELVMVCICGIPAVTLEGTPADWRRLREKVERLADFEVDWWLSSLRSICDHFARASDGDVDLSHWRDIYKRQAAYGHDDANGWLVNLVPYLKNPTTGNFTVRNPLLRSPEAHVSTNVLPGGISETPFTLQDATSASDSPVETAMQFLGGFVGVTQDCATYALRPKLGWAVRRASTLDQLLVAFAQFNPPPALCPAEIDHCAAKLFRHEVPGDLLSFYRRFNGGQLFRAAKRPAFDFRSLEQVELLDPLRIGIEKRGGHDDCQPAGPFLRFCDLADGSFVAIELACSWDEKMSWRVVRAGASANGDSHTSRLIADSFEEFFARALASGGNLDAVAPID